MEQILFYTLISLFFILLLTFKFFSQTKRRRYKNLPPSPISLPIIGHLHLLKVPIHRTFHRLSQIHGPIFSLWFGSQRVVIVSSLPAVQECFTKNDIVLANRPRLLLGKHLSYNNSTISTSSYGEHWRNVRRIGTIEIFSTARLNAFSTIRSDEVKHLLLKLSQNSRDGNFAHVELRSLISELTFNIIMRMVAGKRYYGDDVAMDKEEARRFREIMKEIIALGGTANAADFVPVLNWVWSNGYEKMVVKLAKKTDAFLQGLIDEKRSKGKNGSTMIDHLLSLQESQPEYTDQTIKGLILVMLVAGTDTSALTLEWAMSNLLNQPHILKKARAEVDAEVGQENLMDESDTSKLPYLQSIISETLRMFLAGPMLVPHYASDDCTIGGFDVPRNTMVLINAWAIHRYPELWDDPETFKPERFENTSEDLSHKLIPFGLGRRACPGSGLAQRVLGLTLGSLIQCFEWERVGEEEIDMKEGKGFTLQKAVPLEALCRARPIVSKVLYSKKDFASSGP